MAGSVWHRYICGQGQLGPSWHQLTVGGFSGRGAVLDAVDPAHLDAHIAAAPVGVRQLEPTAGQIHERLWTANKRPGGNRAHAGIVWLHGWRTRLA